MKRFKMMHRRTGVAACGLVAMVAAMVLASRTAERNVAGAEQNGAHGQPPEILLTEDFEVCLSGVLVGQGGWARSEDLDEATGLAEITSPGLEGSGHALFLREKGQGASHALSRDVGAETIAVEFDFVPGVLKRPLTLGLRSGPVGDETRGRASAYIKLDVGRVFHLTTGATKWVEFEGVGWEVARRVRVCLLVDYVGNVSRIKVDGVCSPTIVGDWWTKEKPGNIDITCQFGAGGSKLDNLVVRCQAD